MKCAKSSFTSIGSLFLAVGTLVKTTNGSIADVVRRSMDHTTLYSLITQADIVDALSDNNHTYTMFAPTDEAFEALNGAADKYLTPQFSRHLVDILAYHVTKDRITSADLTICTVCMENAEFCDITSLNPPMINTATIVSPYDISTSNGVVHSIDSVLLPKSTTDDIVDIASSTEDFSTLVSLVQAAGLVDYLKSKGPFTLFAPTNAAFGELSNETVAFLTSSEGKVQLIDILTYHVAPGNYYASVIFDGELTMLNEDVATTATPDFDAMLNSTHIAITINDAEVVQPEILASNGVILPIDKVLLPNA